MQQFASRSNFRIATDQRADVVEAGFLPPSPMILGLGNVLLGDDGAGVHLLERLREDLGTEAAHFIDGGTSSFSLLSHVENATMMLVLESVDIGERPGTFACFEGAAMDRFLAGMKRRSIHEAGLIDVLDIARNLGRLPPRRALLCIQPAHIVSSRRMSQVLEDSAPDALRLAKSVLGSWIKAIGRGG